MRVSRDGMQYEILNNKKLSRMMRTNNLCTHIVTRYQRRYKSYYCMSVDHRSEHVEAGDDEDELFEQLAGVIPYSEEVLVPPQHHGLAVADDVCVHVGFPHPGGESLCGGEAH